ncbi:unnamed protein product, partial [Symbiodinium pilosum]
MERPQPQEPPPWRRRKELRQRQDRREPRAGSGVFAVGEKVRYWSGTHKKWVEAHVQRVNRDADGVLQSYDLTARAQANPASSKLSTEIPVQEVPSTAAGEDAAEASLRPAADTPIPEAAGDRFVNGKAADHFENGEEVQYFSETKERWIDAVVEGHHLKDGVIESYDLNCKKMVPAERLRRAGVQYKVGEHVEYWSASGHRWMSAKA